MVRGIRRLHWMRKDHDGHEQQGRDGCGQESCVVSMSERVIEERAYGVPMNAVELDDCQHGHCIILSAHSQAYDTQVSVLSDSGSSLDC